MVTILPLLVIAIIVRLRKLSYIKYSSISEDLHSKICMYLTPYIAYFIMLFINEENNKYEEFMDGLLNSIIYICVASTLFASCKTYLNRLFLLKCKSIFS